MSICERFLPQVSAFRKEIESINTKVNFTSDSSVRKSFANSRIGGKINFASAPASFTRDNDKFKVYNDTASFTLDSGTEIMSGPFNQPYGRVIQASAYKNRIGNIDKTQPSLSFDNVDFGFKEYPVKNNIEVEFEDGTGNCTGISQTKK